MLSQAWSGPRSDLVRATGSPRVAARQDMPRVLDWGQVLFRRSDPNGGERVVHGVGERGCVPFGVQLLQGVCAELAAQRFDGARVPLLLLGGHRHTE